MIITKQCRCPTLVKIDKLKVNIPITRPVVPSLLLDFVQVFIVKLQPYDKFSMLS